MSRRMISLVAGTAFLLFCTSVAFARPMSALQTEDEAAGTTEELIEDEVVLQDPDVTQECEATDGDGTTEADLGDATDGETTEVGVGDGDVTDCEESPATEPDTEDGEDEEAEDDDEGEGSEAGRPDNHGKAVSTAAHCEGLQGRARGALVSSVARDKSATVESAEAACAAALAEQEAAGAAGSVKANKTKSPKPAKAPKAPKAPKAAKTPKAAKAKAAKAPKVREKVVAARPSAKPVKGPKAHPNKP